MSADRVEIPGAPQLPGLAFRRPRLPEDYGPAGEVFNAMARADGMEFRISREEVAHWYEHATGWDPLLDEVVVDLQDRVVGFADVQYQSDSDSTPVYRLSCVLHPDVRRRGIGTALLAYSEARARERAAREIGPNRTVLLHSWATDAQLGNIALLERAGYVVARYFFDMLRPTLDDIPHMALPVGLDVRPVRPADHRAIFDADAEAFRDHWGGIDDSDAAFGRHFSGPNFRPELWRVAWDGDDVAGVVMSEVMQTYNAEHDTKRVEISGVSVRRPWRGRGLARALVADALRGARDTGMTSATLGVDAANPTGALGVYEAVGFVVDQRSLAYRRPLEAVA